MTTPSPPAQSAIKSLGADRIGGYLVSFGSPADRDLSGEYFTRATQFGLDWYNRRPLLYHHGQDRALGGDLIGVIDTLKLDSTGIWCEAQLDKHNRYLAAIRDLVDKGALGFSSGSLPHLVQKSADGRLDRWIIAEGSLTPTPCQPYRTTVHAVKSAYSALGLSSDALAIENAPHPPTPSPTQAGRRADNDSRTDFVEQETIAVNQPMTVSQALPDPQPVKRLPAASDSAESSAARITVTRATKYSDLSAADMSFMYEILAGADRTWQPSSAFYRELADKSVKAVQRGQLPFDAIRGLESSGWLKSNENDNTLTPGGGQEWAPDSWRGELWLRVRQDNVVAPAMQLIEMPTQPYELPIESTDPTVYYVPETTDQAQMTLGASNPIPQSKIATQKVQMRAQKLALRMAWSSELNEDVLLPIVANFRRQAIRAMQNGIDNVLINGDTTVTANTNVNAIDGTPAASSKYLAFNGLRKYGLVTNNALSYNCNGQVTLPLLRKARFLMNGAYALRPRDCFWLVDDVTYAKLLSMPEFVTRDKFGDQATNDNGLLGRIDGIDVHASAEMGLTNAAGMISTVPANNVKGTAILVFKPLWYVGYRRQVTAVIEAIPWADVYHLTLTARLCLVAQDNVSAAMLYNISV